MFKSLAIPITESSQVGEGRRAAHRLGVEAGLNEGVLSNLGIVATEMGTNLGKFARQGELIVRIVPRPKGLAVELLSVDRGPGITDVGRCMEDGYSTAGTKGNGLGSIKRLASAFDIYSSAKGTVVLAQLWNRDSNAEAAIEIGAVCLPYPGETLCGDAWDFNPVESTLVVADGLGHGAIAAEASQCAIEVFKEQHGLTPQHVLQKMHVAMRSTRGAATLILHLDLQKKRITSSGVGNISSGLVHGEMTKSFVSLNGTLGHQAYRFQEFFYDWIPGSLIVLYSDGLQTKWKLDAYPGLQVRHVSLIAAVLYRDFRRERDDVTVLVVRETRK